MAALLLGLGAMWHTAAGSSAPPPPALDGAATVSAASYVAGSGCDTGLPTTKLTTAKSPDVLFALLAINDTTTTVSSLTLDTGYKSDSVISFSLRSSVTSSSMQLLEYYATVQSIVQTLGVTFTVSASHPAFGLVCALYAFSGIDAKNPFDNNASPLTNSATSATESDKFTTSSQTDLLLFTEADCSNFGPAQALSVTYPASAWTQTFGIGTSQGSGNNCNSVSGNLGLSVNTLTTVTNYPQGTTYTTPLFASAPWTTIAEVITVPRQGSPVGCGYFNGGYCSTVAGSTGFTGFQTISVCPTGNSTFSIGCLALPTQLLGPIVPYILGTFIGGALVLTSLHPPAQRFYLGVKQKRRKLDKRSSLV